MMANYAARRDLYELVLAAQQAALDMVRPADGVPEHFWHTGIRIEDDVLVTPQGHEIFSTAPKSVAEIEQLMSQD